MSKLADNLEKALAWLRKHPDGDSIFWLASISDKDDPSSISLIGSHDSREARIAFAVAYNYLAWRRVQDTGKHIKWIAYDGGIEIELWYMEDVPVAEEKDLGPAKLPEKTADQADLASGFLKA